MPKSSRLDISPVICSTQVEHLSSTLYQELRVPVLSAADAPIFKLGAAPQVVFTGLASPSRGASETSVWRVALAPGTPANPHSLDHEEILVALTGQAVVHLAGAAYPV